MGFERTDRGHTPFLYRGHEKDIQGETPHRGIQICNMAQALNMPEVTVVMPVYNGEKYLRAPNGL